MAGKQFSVISMLLHFILNVTESLNLFMVITIDGYDENKGFVSLKTFHFHGFELIHFSLWFSRNSLCSQRIHISSTTQHQFRFIVVQVSKFNIFVLNRDTAKGSSVQQRPVGLHSHVPNRVEYFVHRHML